MFMRTTHVSAFMPITPLVPHLAKGCALMCSDVLEFGNPSGGCETFALDGLISQAELSQPSSFRCSYDFLIPGDRDSE